MKSCKFKFIRLLFALIMFTIVSAAAPQQALAFTLEVINDNDLKNTLTVAVRYYDSEAEQWATSGWYNVTPGDTKKFKIAKDLYADSVYVYARRGGKEWVNKNSINNDSIIGGVVVNKAFKYYDDAEPSDGRVVGFLHMDMEDGFYSVRFH